MKFNYYEKSLARFLTKYPKLKHISKLFYVWLTFLFYSSKQKYVLNPLVSLEPIDLKSDISFFGYYTSSPEYFGSYIYHSMPHQHIKKRNTEKISIYLNRKKVSETRTWNWQQGSMLNWIDNTHIIHNDINCNNEYCSKIIDIETGTVRIIDRPVYAISKNYKFALGLDFNRLARLRPDYGYFNNKKEYADLDMYSGIYKIDIETGESQSLWTINEIRNYQSKSSMLDSDHKINHIDISPDNNHFIFLHRWITRKGLKYSRLMLSDIEKHTLKVLADEDMVSHCCWKSEQEVVGWLRSSGIDGYFHIDIYTGNHTQVGKGVLNSDGHPSFTKDGSYLLTDTYPDKSRMSSLLIFNMETSNIVELGAFYSSLKYHDLTRCDLHPRFDQDEKAVTIDSVFSGVRKMYKIDVSKIIQNFNYEK